MFNKAVWMMTGVGLILGWAACAYGADEPAPAEQPKAASTAPQAADARARGPLAWRLALMTYTFNQVTLFEAIEKANKLGVNEIETFAWERVGGKHGDMLLNEDMPEAAIADIASKLAENDLHMIGYYANKLGKDKAADRRVFEMLKKFRVRYIVAEPDPKSLDAIEPLAQEFRIRVAIHNHPKKADNAEYTNWHPDNVMKLLEGRSRWVGACADNGHWARSGLDSVEMIKKYKGRLICVHLKDVNKLEPDAYDVPYGTGAIKLKELLAELKNQGFFGTFSIEYENKNNSVEQTTKEAAQCVAWFKKAKEELGILDATPRARRPGARGGAGAGNRNGGNR